ncbi:kynurenine--oxoglutarate transaminase 1, mitochondrial-like [Anneissia japonica]|uniref:kynurenine--oxoglutarate transaminase 1, mitochondrial-like n=1 Tax=Anneissia japonica TaxID=1529436 RepID=UPI0014259ECC|nr:kynurenine--oxoglutarate transaminase 1, mitochondrial-like [Anneissia japonica]
MSKHGPANRIVGLDKNVWVEFSALAAETKALNLGQGFPDFAAPGYMTAALKDVVTSSNPLMNQYTRAFVSLLSQKCLLSQYNVMIIKACHMVNMLVNMVHIFSVVHTVFHCKYDCS